MKRGLSTLIACAALLLAAGCGSSSSSSSSSSTSSTAGSGGSTAAATGTAGGGLKTATTPKFASPPASEAVQSGVVHITYQNISIAPDTVKVKVGSTIIWTNLDSVEHNVTSEGGPQKFASGTFGEGRSYTIKVLKPGVIHYECTIHPTSMNGTIDVVQ
jgi:plastocyanin